MDKKGIGWGIIAGVLLLLIFFIGYFIWQVDFVAWVKEDVAPSASCGISLIEASKQMSLPGKDVGLPVLRCEKIPVEIGAKDSETIKKELLDLITETVDTFSVKKVFSKIEGVYCRKRYHPITFSQKDLKITDFDAYLKKNLPASLVRNLKFYPKEIDTNKEYSILFIVIYDSLYDTWIEKGFSSLLKNVAGLEKSESRYVGFALVESSRIQEELKCNHLV